MAHDLALLTIEGTPLPALQLGDLQKIQEGQVFAFIGFPIEAVFGLFATQKAMVSAITNVYAENLDSEQSWKTRRCW